MKIPELRQLELAAGELAFLPLGQHGFVFKLHQAVFGCDLFLSPLPERLIPPQLSIDEAAQLDFILGTHDHADHIDRDAWRAIAARNPQMRFVIPEAVRAAVSAATGIPDANLIGCDDGRSLELDGVTITGIAAAHEFLDPDAAGHYPYLGYGCAANGTRIYHAGDCCIYPGLYEKLAAYHWDAMFLPINGRDAQRLRANCIGNMTYQEAADLAGWLHPTWVVPTHYDMFAMNAADPKLFSDYLNVKYPAQKTTTPHPGSLQILRR